MVKRLLLILFILSSLVIAEGDEEGLKISTWGWYTFGRVQSAYDERQNRTGSEDNRNDLYDIDFTGEVLSDFAAGIKITHTFDDYTKLRVHPGVITTFVTTDPEKPNIEYRAIRSAPFLIEAAFEYNPPIGGDDKLKFEFGYIPAVYNPDAVNLGAYLFRSTPYPTVFENGFERSLVLKPKQPGLHVEYTKMLNEDSWAKIEGYFSTQMKYYPNFDFSPSLLGTVNFGNVFEFGAGAMYHNAISVFEDRTTPGRVRELYTDRYLYLDPASERQDSVLVPYEELPGDTTWEWQTYNVYDTTYYTFRGLKLMGRFSFDPKPLFGIDDEYGPFSSADLKVFAEGAILGLKNYPGWFNDITERIPIMVGVNLPTFKLLDLFCVQFQYFKSPYWNTWEDMWRFESPVPYNGKSYEADYETWVADDSTFEKIHDDDIKWSIYLSKSTFSKKLRFSFQIANDNFMKQGWMPPPPSQRKYTELTRRTWKDWYLMGRITYYAF